VRKNRCHCPPGGHTLGCHVGDKMWDATISVLEWVLEENDLEERVAERLSAIAAREGGGKEEAT
jgi:hypothetical protein